MVTKNNSKLYGKEGKWKLLYDWKCPFIVCLKDGGHKVMYSYSLSKYHIILGEVMLLTLKGGLLFVWALDIIHNCG